ncbi:MAG: membrane protein insertase YidC [Bacteroidales bacterium]|nr:membrane protein insertase YidC [Bacteroidales bacterium]
MTKENILGLVLIAAILIGYSIWMAPSEEERLEARRLQDSIREVQLRERARAEAILEEQARQVEDDMAGMPETFTDPAVKDSLEQNRIRSRMGYFSRSAIGEEEYFVLENDVMKLKVTTKGGHPYSVELKDYKTFEQEPLKLFRGEDKQFSFSFFSADGRSISTDQLFFTPYINNQPYSGGQSIIHPGSADQLRFALRAYSDFHSNDQPSYIEFAYGLHPGEYMVDFEVNFVGTRQAIAPNTTDINLDWRSKLLRQEKNRQNEQNNTTVYYRYTHDEVSRIRPTRDGAERLTTSVLWISYKQQFFSSTLIAPAGFSSADVESKTLGEDQDDYLKEMAASIKLDYDARTNNLYSMQWYFGPNNYRILSHYQLDLERQIPLGWGFFLMSWINRFAVIPIFNFLDGYQLNYGIIILILTILLKIVLLPIAYKTYISQAKMRVLKPEIDELAKKYPKKEDAMKKQQATMALYKKAGVNPMAGCVPMLLQLPILLALFRFFPASIELRQQGFLWADDLSSYDSILDLPFTIPFYGDHVSLFTLLMAGSMVLYTHLNSQMMSSSNQMPGMKTMMYMMPVMLLGIFNSFASGLSYYYFLANVITFGQMFIFKRMIDEDALHAKIEENKKKPVKKSKWQQRMEQLAKQQEEAQKKRRKK